MVQTGAPQPRLGSAPQRVQPVRPPKAPPYIADRVDDLGRGFNGRVGIAVRSVNEGWSTSWNGNELNPQQSVSKLWVAITALDAVDKGRVSLNDKVTLTRTDLTLFHQPIATKISSWPGGTGPSSGVPRTTWSGAMRNGRSGRPGRASCRVTMVGVLPKSM